MMSVANHMVLIASIGTSPAVLTEPVWACVQMENLV